jgi:hypothetical protein
VSFLLIADACYPLRIARSSRVMLGPAKVSRLAKQSIVNVVVVGFQKNYKFIKQVIT